MEIIVIMQKEGMPYHLCSSIFSNSKKEREVAKVKALKKILSLTLCMLLLSSAIPMAMAEDATDATTTTKTVRIEAEDYVAALSTTSMASIATSATTDAEQASAGKFLNNCRLNDIICLGEVDLTGLQSITLSIASNTNIPVFNFTVDGTDTVIATITTAHTAGWTTFEEFTATISPTVSAADLVGTHILYMTVASSSSLYGGNADYVELTKTTPVVEETTTTVSFYEKLNTALSSNYNKESGNQNIGSTKDSTILAVSDVVLDDLSAITINHAPFNNANITVDIYYGDTYDTATLLMTCDLTETKNNSGNWHDADNYRDEKFEVPEGVNPTDTTNLFFDLNTTNNYAGNYKTFTLHYGTATVIKSEKSLNFADDIDTNLSTTPYKVNTASHLVESTGTGTVLAYPNIQTKGLTGVSFNCSPTTDLKVELYCGETMDTATLVATPTLNSALLDGVAANEWYGTSNARESAVIPLDMSSITTDTTTLFFKLTAGRGNFYDFTLYYAEPIDDALNDICQIEVEEYVWGAASGSPNWIRATPATQVDSPNSGDFFYLGKADLSNLNYISVCLAKDDAASEVTFYADPTVDFDALTEHTTIGANGDSAPLDHDRYQYTTDPLSGGIEIAKVTLGSTGGWTTYGSFYTVIDDATKTALGNGKHEIYMKVTGSNRGGNIDYIRFNGLSKSDFDTTSNWPQGELAVKFVGHFQDEVVYTTTVTRADQLADLLTTVKAPALGGYTFVGWNESADDAAAIFDTNKDQNLVYEIEPVYSTGDNEGKRLTYDVTIGENITSSNQTIADSQIKDIYFDERVELTLADGVEGSVDYWMLDGQKLAYGETGFTFYVTGANQVSVVLVNGEASAPEASVSIQQYATSATNNGDAYTYTLSVIAQTYVPEGNATAYGVYYAASTDELQKIKDKDDTAKYLQVVSSKSGNNEQYMTHLLSVKAGKTRYAMAYAVIGDQTVYSTQTLCFITGTDGTVTVTTL